MKTSYSFVVILAVGLLFAACGRKSASGDAAIDARVDSVMALMTFEEKVGQLNQIDANYVSDDIKRDIAAGKIGSLLNCPAEQAVVSYQRNNHIVIHAGENSKDSIHGASGAL